MTDGIEPDTVYLAIKFGATPIYSSSSIVTWKDWPADVRDVVRRWNGPDHRLRFVYLPMSTFVCFDCLRRIDVGNATACKLDGLLFCDDCVIGRVRRFGRRGRPETELEKMRRFLTDAQRKIARQRYNAVHERKHVVGILRRVESAQERAFDELTGVRRDDVVPGLSEAREALDEIATVIRPYLTKNGGLADGDA